jgi:Zn-dependent protease with chaperone function
VTVLSVLVLTAAAAAVGLLVWATVLPKGPWGWVGVAAGWGLVAALAPRPVRLEPETELDRDRFPATHRLLDELAARVGVRAPATVHVDSDFGAGVVATGWTLRPAVVVGLPLWTCLTDDERVALLCHELGHLRGRDTAHAVLNAQAHALLERLATLLTPLPRDAVGELEDTRVGMEGSEATMNGVGRAVLTVVSLPAVLLLLAFERAASHDSQLREYAADLRAAEVAGTDGTVRLLLTTMGIAGVHTVAGAAVRRREDPFEALALVRDRAPLTASQVAQARTRAREEDLRWDATHPRDDLRLGVLEAHPTAPEPHLLAERRALVQAADHELTGLRPALARPLRDDLLETWI